MGPLSFCRLAGRNKYNSFAVEQLFFFSKLRCRKNQKPKALITCQFTPLSKRGSSEDQRRVPEVLPSRKVARYLGTSKCNSSCSSIPGHEIQYGLITTIKLIVVGERLTVFSGDWVLCKCICKPAKEILGSGIGTPGPIDHAVRAHQAGRALIAKKRSWIVLILEFEMCSP